MIRIGAKVSGRSWFPGVSALWALLLLSLPVASQEVPLLPDIPDTQSALSWLLQDPDVLAAEASLAAAGFRAEQLRVSPNEWALRLGKSRRSFEAGSDSNEWSAQLERQVRLPNKTSLDRELAGSVESLAEAQFGEAIHEAAITLVDMLMDLQRATQLRALLEQQAGAANDNMRAVEARLRSGDAARLDVNLAEADLADVQRRLSEMQVQASKARMRLVTRFPGSEPQALTSADPVPVAGSLAIWSTRIVSQSDELKIARSEFGEATAAAARARAERMPDPIVGLFTASEVYGNERVIGLNVTVPLPGRYRSARVGEARSLANAAQARLTQAERVLDARVAETFADAQGSYDRWRLAQTAAAKAEDSAALMRRAYTLGESDVQALIIARRQALDAAITAVEARSAARLAHLHLLVDAHLIWDLENH